VREPISRVEQHISVLGDEHCPGETAGNGVTLEPGTQCVDHFGFAHPRHRKVRGAWNSINAKTCDPMWFCSVHDDDETAKLIRVPSWTETGERRERRLLQPA